MLKKPSKPSGWWSTHPTLMTVSVHGTYDGNGDGLGDFQGLRQKLDFFKEIGITGYRFQHIGPYGNDYKWWGLVLQDWYNVDPRYGTMEDFEQFMEDCREKDIKIIMMSIPEYVGWQHPDYLAAKEARRKGVKDPRVDWFHWNDDGTVLTCWERPAPNVGNPAYMEAFLKHIGFWMDKGVAGWDADAVGTWHNLNLDTLRRYNEFVIKRGGFSTAENMVLQRDVTKYGGFNAGTGYIRHEYYNELKAIMEHNAEYIRDALKVREQLIHHGMFPYQQFGDQTFRTLRNSWSSHILEMFKQQAAFNAVLPDQVWVLANALTFSDVSDDMDSDHKWGTIDWIEIEKQEHNADSPFSHIERLFSLRATHKELAIGDIEEVETNHPKDVFAAIRTSEDGEEQAIVVFNFSNEFKNVVVQLPGITTSKLRNYLNGDELEVVNGSIQLNMNLYGYKFLKILK